MTALFMHLRFRQFYPGFFILPVILLFIYLSLVSVSGAAEKKNELLIGIEPEHNIFDQVQRYRVLAGYLSDKLGLEVKLTIMSRYGEVVKRFKALRLDGALLSSYTATLAMNELGLIPVVNMVDRNKKSTSQGYVFVRRDSGIDGIGDMRGTRVVFVDSATTEGYLFARSLFSQYGIQELDSYFSRHYFAGSHASAVFAVLDGRADVGSAKDSVYDQLVSGDKSIQHELSIIAESPEVPEITLCIKSELGPGLLEKLRTVLLNMNRSAEGHKVLKQLQASSFVQSVPDDFAVVLEMAEDAGVNMLKSGNN